MDLKGHTAIVTGAARGIGRAIAEELAIRGVALSLCDIDEEGLKTLSSHLQKLGAPSVYYEMVNVEREIEIQKFVHETEREFSSVQILVNNAGIHPLHVMEEISTDEWDKVLAINLRSHFIFAKEVLPGMREKKYGRIINIASEAGKNGGTVAAAHYAASKAGVLGFTRNLAQQIGMDGITVNAICPGRIKTDMALAAGEDENKKFIENSILKRIGEPQDIAFAVAYLASPRAKFVTAESMMVNGGTLRD